MNTPNVVESLVRETSGTGLLDRGDVREIVRQKYGEAALSVLSGQGAACCGGNANGGGGDSCCESSSITGNLYSETEAGEIQNPPCSRRSVAATRPRSRNSDQARRYSILGAAAGLMCYCRRGVSGRRAGRSA